MIVNVRGNGGSGKTFTVRHVMDKLNAQPFKKNEKGKVLYYHLDNDIYVIGSYATACGGCDTISDVNDTQSYIEECVSLGGSVVFEGLLLSGCYGRWLGVSKKLGDFVWAFMDTPIETCLERTKQRRIARGDLRPLNPKNTIGKARAVYLS